MKSSVEAEADNTVELRAVLTCSTGLRPLRRPNTAEAGKSEYAK